jgi:hypothetical protein
MSTALVSKYSSNIVESTYTRSDDNDLMFNNNEQSKKLRKKKRTKGQVIRFYHQIK